MKIFKKNNNKKSTSPPTNSPVSPGGSQKYPTNEKFANSKVFGKKLPLEPNDLPPFVLKAMSYLEEYGLKIEGIFRISPKKSDEDEVIQQLELNIKYDVPYEKYEIHLASSLLKLYLRELMDPLLTYEQYGMFLAAERIPDEEQRLIMIQKVIKFLPPTNFTILQKLCAFLKRVAANSSINKMSPSNLAIVFAPNLLKSDLPQTHMEILQDSKYSSNLMTTLIAEAHSIFGIGDADQQSNNNDNSNGSSSKTATTTSSSPTHNNHATQATSSPSANNTVSHLKTTSGYLRPLPTPASPHMTFDSPPVMLNPFQTPTTDQPPVMEIMDTNSPSRRQPVTTNSPVTATVTACTTNTANTTNTTSGTSTEEQLEEGWAAYFDSNSQAYYYHHHQSGTTTWDKPIKQQQQQQQQQQQEVQTQQEEVQQQVNDHMEYASKSSSDEEMNQPTEDQTTTEGSQESTVRKIKIPVRKRAVVRDMRRPLPNPNAPRYQSTVGNRVMSRKSVGGYESDEACIVDEEEE